MSAVSLHSNTMKLLPRPIYRPNLDKILFVEAKRFVSQHQPHLSSTIYDLVNLVLQPFFVLFVFPLAEKWVTTVTKTAMTELQSPMTIEVTSDKKISKDDEDRIINLIETSREINTVFILEKMMKNVEDNKESFKVRSGFNLNWFLPQWWMGVKEAWHGIFIKSFVTSMDATFERKSMISGGVINLTEAVIPDEMLKVLQKGKKYVPAVRESATAAIRRFYSELLDQAVLYARKIEGRKVNISKADSNSPLGFIGKLKNDSSSAQAKIFYMRLLEGAVAAAKKIEENVASNNEYGIDINDYKIDGCVWNIADKDRGIVLISAEVMRFKEMNMMESLEAVKVDLSTVEILEQIIKEENILRSICDIEQKRFLSEFPPMRREHMTFSFMKLQAKVHKLSEEQIRSKDVSALKFRPVNDSKMFPTKPASLALLKLLRLLIESVVKMFPRLHNILPASGWDISRHLHSSTSFQDTGFSLFYSCDLGDAYSNCDLTNLESAVTLLYGVVGDPGGWRENLVIKLARFVFGNNYVEAGGCYWKCGCKLPMGSPASGEALDVICLAGEVVNLVGIDDCCREKCPLYLRDIRSTISVDSYNRYKDDTKIVDHSSDPYVILSNLKKVATNIFPPHIPISFEVSVFYGGFLDCVFFRNFSSNSFVTTSRVNFTAPNPWPEASSSTPYNFVSCAFITNVIRAYRLCNNNTLFDQYVGFLQKEMYDKNYTHKRVMSTTRKAMEHVEKLSPYTLRSEASNTSDENVIFCKPLLYSPLSGTDSVLRSLLKSAYSTSGQKHLVNIPAARSGTKLQNIVFTKKNHRNLMEQLRKSDN